MQEKCDELMGFFSSLMWIPCNTFRETTVSHLIYAARLKLKWILSCCGLKKAEANNITTKEPLSKVVRRWKSTYPCLRSLSGQPGGVGLEEGRDCASPKALNSATSPEEPRSVLGACNVHRVPPLWASQQSSKSWLLTESGYNGLPQNIFCNVAEFYQPLGWPCMVWSMEKVGS